ncbi:alpha/beta hydrolase family protein [Maribacter chungangensis]|uniref:Alpha/beta hydrolase family protein n=2 Tax=Maribacter chungangensis TaxID=1069117 RepID=A0ABW3B2R5_9FLAO
MKYVFPDVKEVNMAKGLSILLVTLLLFLSKNKVTAQSLEEVETKNVTFDSEGIKLAGTIYSPKQPNAALVIVHGSDPVPRMTKFAEILAKNNILVLTYDKRGVGESGGVYVGPQVGTNNISTDNLNLLAKDASTAVNIMFKENINIPIGVIGFSQAGWIMPIAANENPLIEFMVLFSCPTITTLEQLRFQFYTNGREDFWDTHTEEDARKHIKNDPDRYQFTGTDPKTTLSNLSTPGLWLFGEKDIQIPAKMCIEHLNTLKAQGKPFEYTLFPTLGHNTAFANTTEPIDISIHWIKQKAKELSKKKVTKTYKKL